MQMEAGLQVRGVLEFRESPLYRGPRLTNLVRANTTPDRSTGWQALGFGQEGRVRGRADLGSDLFLVWDGLFGELRHFVALLGTSVPRSVRGCYRTGQGRQDG
ncbi:unnamed protein product [Microthlaspi erraticum]|uniref:Uncharacterized protein n=1 Tax=Microthlaspi erraticum TaxID=1685480 RepID=A0A6D2J3M7_9BRAS|nr:unnamed protein product [Microthlaspi erraticum]